MGRRICQIVVPIKSGADFRPLGDDRRGRIGESGDRREVPDIIADAQTLGRGVDDIVCPNRNDRPKAELDRETFGDRQGACELRRPYGSKEARPRDFDIRVADPFDATSWGSLRTAVRILFPQGLFRPRRPSRQGPVHRNVN